MSSLELVEERPVTLMEQHPKSRRVSAAFLLVILALAVRVGLLAAIYGIPFHYPAPTIDGSFFNETTDIAASIAGGYGFSSPMEPVAFGSTGAGPSAWIAPVYPYFCALVFRLSDTFSPGSMWAILLLQCMFSALTVIPILRIAKLTTGMRTGYVAAILWALFPWFSKWAVTWVWEVSLSAFLFSWLFWFALRMRDEATLRTWIGFGALWGFAALVNPALLPLLLISGLWIAYQRSRRGMPWLKSGVLSAAVCLLIISPWLIRNRVVFGEWVFIRDNFGFEFALGNYHGSNGRGWAHFHPTGSPKELHDYSTMGELRYVRMKTELGKQFVRAYPGEFLRLTAKRVLWFWDGSAIRYTYEIPWFWMPWSFGLFSIVLVPSLLLACAKRINGWALFLGAILLYPIPYYLTYSQLRYRQTLEPLMLLLVVWAVGDTIARFRSKPVIP